MSFQFKKFLIEQQHCAMKVCTDACLLGAYTPVNAAKTILDIGTGTGLLSLMLAQRSSANIDAVEIDLLAAQQATANVANSCFAGQIRVIHADIKEFARHPPLPGYDLIISNPPFFAQALRPLNAARARARHDATLTMTDLLHCVSVLLKPSGRFCVILPPTETAQLNKIMLKSGLHLNTQIKIQHTDLHPPHCLISVCSYQHSSLHSELIPIYDNTGKTYTDTAHDLLKEYYLYL